MVGFFGLRASERGTITYLGKHLKITRPKNAIENGIALLTEDRRGSGIFGVLSVSDNVSVASLQQYLIMHTMLNDKKIAQLVKDNVKKLSIKTPSIKTPIQSLSGGNQQKVIISRWLANDPDVLIMDEPTRGIDVGAKYEIYCIIAELAKQGKSIIMISSEMPELIGMADRIMVMHKGKVEQIGTPFDIYTHPRTLFVADFIGQANVLAGTLESRESAVIGSIRIGDRVIPGKLIAEENYTAGERVSLILRPEAVTLSAKEDGVLSGTVSSAVFSGDRMEYMVRLSNGQEVSVMENFFPGAEIYSTGQQVQLTFDPRLTVVLPGER